MVDIYVGPSKKCFRLYKANICGRIPCFDRMLNKNSEITSGNVVYLEEDDTASFDLLAEWANFPMTSTHLRHIRKLRTVIDKDGNKVASWDSVGFYSLTEKYGSLELQDVIMDEVIQIHKDLDEYSSVEFVLRTYKNASARSHWARYCAEIILYVIDTCAEDDR
jgi:hypothetical protein